MRGGLGRGLAWGLIGGTLLWKLRKTRRESKGFDLSQGRLPILIAPNRVGFGHSASRLRQCREAKVALTFDPPWTPERMSEEAKIALGWF